MPTFTVDGFAIQYGMMGQGTPIALTPGGRNAKEALLPLAEKLASHCRVLLWDRRNTGASDVFIGGDGSEQETWADDLTRLLTHVGLAPAYLGGGSAGCRVSVLTALRHPEVVKGLALWSASGGPYGSQVLGYDYHVPYIRAAQSGGMAAVAETPFFAERIQANPANRQRLMALDPQEFVAVMRRWNTFFYYREETPIIGATEEQLRRITVPTLIVQGNDDIHPVEASAALHRSISGSQLLPSAWTREDFMGLYTGRIQGSVMQLYSRLAEPILDFLAKAESRVAAGS